jgi:cell division protein FtsB
MAEFADVLFGNLAYNNAAETAVPETEFPNQRREIPKDEPEQNNIGSEKTRTREKVHLGAKANVKPKTRQYIPFFAVMGTLLVSFVMIKLLNSYISLTRLSNESAQLELQITEMEKKQAKLEIQYESAFNLEQVEKYAMAELGMVKAGNEQKVYVNNRLDDKAVILSNARPAPTDKFKAFLGSLLVYLQ